MKKEQCFFFMHRWCQWTLMANQTGLVMKYEYRECKKCSKRQYREVT